MNIETAAGVLLVTVASAADLPQIVALRHEVFVLGQNVPVELEQDGLDAEAVHVVAWATDPDVSASAPPVLVGTGRMLGTPPEPGRVGRMAVRQDARSGGIGTAVLRGLERAAIRRGNPAIDLHAQAHARGFYARNGYHEVGPEFEEAGITHVAMRRDLPVLRPVRNEDSEALIGLIGGCWAEYPGTVLDVDGEEPWLRGPADYYAKVDGRMWVAELGGAVVGCAGIRPVDGEPPAAELKSLYVAAAARRHGLGEVLNSMVEDEALRWGVQRLELWTDTRFADAHRFYDRLGYTRLPHQRELHDKSATVEYAYVKNFPYADRVMAAPAG